MRAGAFSTRRTSDAWSAPPVFRYETLTLSPAAMRSGERRLSARRCRGGPDALADDGGVGDHEEGLRERGATAGGPPSIVSESWPTALTVPLDRASGAGRRGTGAGRGNSADVRGVWFAGRLVVGDRDGLPHRQHIAQLSGRVCRRRPSLDAGFRRRGSRPASSSPPVKVIKLVGDLDGERGAADLGDGAARSGLRWRPGRLPRAATPIRESAVRVTARNVEFMSASLDESRGANKVMFDWTAD